MKITIQSLQFTADQKLIDRAEARLQKLSQYYDRIIDVTLIMKLDGRSGQIKDKEVELLINIPGTQIFARSTSKVFEESLDDVIESGTRQLNKFKEKLRIA